ncbi:MAG: protoporphyrinogen oxidase [Planctomycetia bacterium]|nr:protoporphyrinogen oxidase [Planctomycetia bacterium]
MNDQATSPQRLIVIGGGISGLAAACRLRELAPAADVTLLEAGTRVGGLLQTSRRDGFLIEHSADSFVTDVPWATDFCRRHGLETQLIPTQPIGRRAFIAWRGRLLPVPAGFTLMAPARLWPVVTSPLLSVRGKLRLLCEPFIGRRGLDEPEESLAEFATRRLGREAFERIVQPLVSGVYSADPTKLSVAAALPRFVEMERTHGSLWRAARHAATKRAAAKTALGSQEATGNSQESGARYGLFVAPRGGMSSLVEAIAASLPSSAIRLNSPVTAIERAGRGGWNVHLVDEAEPLFADALVLATPAPAAAKLLMPLDAEAGRLCGGVPHTGCAVVALGYRADANTRLPEGFGFVVPAIERRPILAASFSSAKFPDRAAAGHLLVRVFIGGAERQDLLSCSDEELRRIAVEQLAELAGLKNPPELTEISRYPNSMPQYHVGHAARVIQLEERIAALGPLALAGNAYHGVGIPHCIRSGERAAEETLQRARVPGAERSAAQ